MANVSAVFQTVAQTILVRMELGGFYISGVLGRSDACLSACAAIELEYDVAQSLSLWERIYAIVVAIFDFEWLYLHNSTTK